MQDYNLTLVDIGRALPFLMKIDRELEQTLADRLEKSRQKASRDRKPTCDVPMNIEEHEAWESAMRKVEVDRRGKD